MSDLASLYRYSNMLKDFIIDEMSKPSSRNVDKNRYNNLKLFMDLERFPIPHICVRIGISEGVISLESGDLIYGSIGQDAMLIKKWLRRSAVYAELLRIWNLNNLEKSKEEQTQKEELDKKKKSDLDEFFK